MFYHLPTSVGQNIESSPGIEPQTFGFCAQTLHYYKCKIVYQNISLIHIFFN